VRTQLEARGDFRRTSKNLASTGAAGDADRAAACGQFLPLATVSYLAPN
jgi:hypothetical protein